MSVNQAPARQGRPKDLNKRAAIIAAAIVLFGRQSYDSVTMEAVAAAAGVSKMTIYSHFSDKETLFESIVTSVSDRYMSAFPVSEVSEGPLAERLNGIGVGYLSVILSADVVSMAHTLSSELRTDEVLAQRFFAAGPGRVRAALAAIIEAAVASGDLRVDHVSRAAEDLISLWAGSVPTQLSFGLIAPATAKEINRRVHRGTDVFMRAYAVAPGQSADKSQPRSKAQARRTRA